MPQEVNARAQIQRAVLTANDETGGADRSYETITTIWVSVENVSEYVQAVRASGQQAQVTHHFKTRAGSVQSIGRAYTLGFSSAYKIMSDIYALKKDWFIFIQDRSVNAGRRFKIIDVSLDEYWGEWVKFTACYIEESGTGAPV